MICFMCNAKHNIETNRYNEGRIANSLFSA